MAETLPTRVWWRRKRTTAFALLWVLLANPVAHGPAVYATKRGWVTVPVYQHLFGPSLALRSFLPELLAVGHAEYCR